jgi:hypothetical protein
MMRVGQGALTRPYDVDAFSSVDSAEQHAMLRQQSDVENGMYEDDGCGR